MLSLGSQLSCTGQSDLKYPLEVNSYVIATRTKYTRLSAQNEEHIPATFNRDSKNYIEIRNFRQC